MYPAMDAVAQGELVSCVQCRYVPHARHTKQTFWAIIRSDYAVHIQNHSADDPALVLSPTLFVGSRHGLSHQSAFLIIRLAIISAPASPYA